MSRGAAGAPLLIVLPHGLNVSGVAMWAVRLAGELGRAGRTTGLVLHREPEGQKRLDAELSGVTRVFDVSHLPPIETCGGELAPYVNAYRSAVDELGRLAGDSASPVVISPNLLGDCYGAGAMLAAEAPARYRLVGWQHSDIAYDTAVLGYYEPVLSRLVGVSDAIISRLGAAMPGRREKVVNIPYGVPVPEAVPIRRTPSETGEVRLVYTGRLEHAQKRIGALPLLSDELARRGVRHRLTLVGDGPAATEMDAAAAVREGRLFRRPALSPMEVEHELDRSHALVLASRYEGLSVSMLEAMARGCVPVATRVASGAAQAVDDGVNGLLAYADADASEQETASALADSVERLIGSDGLAMSVGAWERVRDRFSLASHSLKVGVMIDAVASGPALGGGWPAGKRFAFTGSLGAGTVPADGGARIEAVLSRLAGRRIVLHGAGRHTVELASAIRAAVSAYGVEIVAVCEDDKARLGGRVGTWPIIDPWAASESGATDVVLSSWLHEAAIWARRAVYEQQGMRVWRVYGGE
ncbi:MAG: glycosyltransferase family 4 protein [Phycisphaerales bacterium]|nr:glycosyltransferase family 4 protein [Phycisphaerales bacterium]